ncbi:MAG: hypothetical protein K8Q89_02495 [Nitrosarchaeum sp.]|nr:hypothetical protein [Nitrosarchaeum sp.]
MSKNCPSCNSKNIAKIFWGLPADMGSLEEELNRKEIVLGGCNVTSYDPKWECTDYHHRWR